MKIERKHISTVLEERLIGVEPYELVQQSQTGT